MANTMKNWNLTIQWWMSNFVHRKLPFKNRNLRQGKVFCFLFITLSLQGYTIQKKFRCRIIRMAHIRYIAYYNSNMAPRLVSHISIFGLVSFVPKVCNFAHKAMESCQNFNIIIIEHGPSFKPLSKGLKKINGLMHSQINTHASGFIRQSTVCWLQLQYIHLFVYQLMTMINDIISFFVGWHDTL